MIFEAIIIPGMLRFFCKFKQNEGVAEGGELSYLYK